jgi:MscS family membrane protein
MTPGRRRRSRAAATLAAFLAWSSYARAAPPEPDAGSTVSAAVAVDVGPSVADDSPRAAVNEFLALVRGGRGAAAARFLEGADPGRGADLAVRLKAVLDRHLWIDLERISPRPDGDRDDGLAPGVDRLGSVPADGRRDAVLLVRRADAGGARWVFPAEVVARIDAWYAELPRRWLLDNLPPALRRTGPYDLAYWQWLALPVLVLAAWLVGAFLARLTRAIATRVASRTAARWDEALLGRIAGPLTGAWALALAAAAVPALGLVAPAEDGAQRVLHGGFLLVFFWALGRSVDVARDVVASAAWATAHPSARALLPLAAKIAKIGIYAIAVVAMLSSLGYPVASLIAGLGIGGLALALAAQKTVENLFGAFSIGTDQPFREGDFVRVEDLVGTVETIGLRSTRIRTLDRTLVTIPNAKVADARLETFAARDRIRLACTIGLTYDTTAAQMRSVLAGFERVLREHPAIWPDAVTVRFKELANSSLDIEVMAWFQTSDWSAFQAIRQEILLRFMEIVETSGSSFAFPTQTVHLVRDAEAGRPVGAAPERA